MKTRTLLIYAAPLLFLLALACPRAGAQRPAAQRVEESDESLGKFLGQLDAAGLATARVGLYGYYYEDKGINYTTGVSESEMRYTYALFSRGFKFVKVEGCSLTLRNDDAAVLDYSDGRRAVPVCGGDGPCEHRVAEMHLSLRQMSDRKNSGPRRQNFKPEKARAFGLWRTDFNHGGLISKNIVGLNFFPAARWDKRIFFDGTKVSFSFDDEATGAKFHALLVRAIKMCEDQ